MSQPLIIALSAGEASGDLLGAHLIEAIKKQHPDAQFVGIGGARMTAAGCQSLFDQERLAVRGYAEVIKRLPEILKIRRELVARLKQIRPNVFVGIDAPDFNLGVAEQLKAAGIPTVHYVSPSVWAWKRERVNKIVRQVNQVLCLFPMEAPLYQAARTELACAAADAVLVTSGTATLEVALCKRPMVISYKLSALTYWLVKRKIQVPHVGLPNILLNKAVVPELLQADATPEKLAAALLDWYRQPEKVAALEADFVHLHEMLKLNTDELAAGAVLAECR